MSIEEILLEQVKLCKTGLDNDKIEVLWNKEVTEIHGAENVESVSLADTKDGSSSELNIDGVFMAIGIPQT